MRGRNLVKKAGVASAKSAPSLDCLEWAYLKEKSHVRSVWGVNNPLSRRDMSEA